MTHPDVNMGDVAVKVCDNLSSLEVKLNREQEKTRPNQYLLKRIMFQIKAAKNGLRRIQSQTGHFSPPLVISG